MQLDLLDGAGGFFFFAGLGEFGHAGADPGVRVVDVVEEDGLRLVALGGDSGSGEG